MRFLIEDPFWNEQETMFTSTLWSEEPRSTFLIFCEWTHSKADNVTPFNSGWK